jgi:hypothetical protein
MRMRMKLKITNLVDGKTLKNIATINSKELMFFTRVMFTIPNTLAQTIGKM